MKLELLKVTIEKEKLLKAPVPERAFYLKVMNFLTDVSILQKCCWHSGPKTDEVNPVKQSAEIIQAMFFVRHLAGLLLEGYELIRTGFFANKLGRIYQIKELETIKEYFNKENLIEKIRNKFAYHLDIELVGNEIEKFPDDEDWVIYLVKEIKELSNNLYEVGDNILLSAIVRFANEKTVQEGLSPVLNEILQMATTLQTFFAEFVIIFHEKYLGFKHKQEICLDIPRLHEVHIPYFVSRD